MMDGVRACLDGEAGLNDGNGVYTASQRQFKV